MDFSVSKTGVLILKNKIFEDARGFFWEIYAEDKFADIYDKAFGFYPPRFVQDNLSKSKKNVVRGMHFQVNNPQGKFVRSLNGRVLDVVIDLRRDSGTFGYCESFELSPNGNSIYVPEGFAHGFWSLDEDVLFHYKCTNLYDKSDEDGLNPMDEDIKYPWLSSGEKLIVSDKDMLLKKWRDYV